MFKPGTLVYHIESGETGFVVRPPEWYDGPEMLVVWEDDEYVCLAYEHEIGRL